MCVPFSWLYACGIADAVGLATGWYQTKRAGPTRSAGVCAVLAHDAAFANADAVHLPNVLLSAQYAARGLSLFRRIFHRMLTVLRHCHYSVGRSASTALLCHNRCPPRQNDWSVMVCSLSRIAKQCSSGSVGTPFLSSSKMCSTCHLTRCYGAERFVQSLRLIAGRIK